MEFLNGFRSWLIAKGRVFLLVGILALAGCVKYRPLPIDPPQVERDYRARTLADMGLRAYVEANSSPTASQWPPSAFDLGTLTLVAFYYSPEMEVSRAQVGTAEAGILTAGARPNPTVGIGAGHSSSPESPFLFRFSFDLPFEMAGKRGHRIERAERLTEAARLALGETAWRVRARVRAALLDHLLALKQLELLRAERGLRNDAVALLDRRLAVGEASRPDVELVRANRAQTDLAVRFGEGRVAETRSALAVALSLPVAALDGASFVWPNLEKPPDEAAVSPAMVQRAGLLNRLDVQRGLVEYAAAETALQIEIAKQVPDIRLGPGYSFDEGHNNFTFVPSLTLPVFNRNIGPIREAEARRKESAARFLALQSNILGEVESSLTRYRAALAEFSEADTTLLALRERREAVILRAVDLGEEDRLALLGLRLETVGAAQARLEALRRAQLGLGALEDAVQRPLEPANPLPQVSAENPRDNERKDSSR